MAARLAKVRWTTVDVCHIMAFYPLLFLSFATQGSGGVTDFLPSTLEAKARPSISQPPLQLGYSCDPGSANQTFQPWHTVTGHGEFLQSWWHSPFLGSSTREGFPCLGCVCTAGSGLLPTMTLQGPVTQTPLVPIPALSSNLQNSGGSEAYLFL